MSSELVKEVARLRQAFKEDLNKAQNVKDVEQLKVIYLGRKGPIQGLMRHLKSASDQERPQWGQLINTLKVELTTLCDEALEGYGIAELAKKLDAEGIDISEPGRCSYLGRKHPAQQMLEECLEILSSMGFTVQYGPDIDTDYYNFEALNFPHDHPARDMQDTFYIDKDHLLRTHTSNTQVRVMENNKPPIRIVSPGKSYRNENISARSHVFFHQIEGLYIDKGVSFADLMSTMHEFWSRVFQKDVQTRFRPSYFPFVEPGLEVDIRCTACEGSGCPICKHTGWLEVCGAGMVHPEVLKYGGIDPEVYSGYAWGIGPERLAMLRWKINDIRLFWENDMRFLAQF
jgi:phenylalanyl-tRNA synthetase alpha chain